MEQQQSSHSLSSIGPSGTEVGSRYIMESGFHMTSLTATIFVAALLTSGILLITLIIALAMMLKSCQSQSGGIVENLPKSNHYCNHCNIFYLHLELNSLEAKEVVDFFPSSICIDCALRYIKEGEYARDLETTVQIIDNYFKTVQRVEDGLDAVLMDIDDVLSSNNRHYNTHLIIEEAMHLKQMAILRLYTKLRTSGWPLLLLSRKPDTERNSTIRHLNSLGIDSWSLLLMRLEGGSQISSRTYFARERGVLENVGGMRIEGVISSCMDVLTVLGKRMFKIPNPPLYHYNSKLHTQSEVA